jgi:hypothetical protein
VSTLAVNAVTDANGGNTATINSMTPTADSLQGFRNRIINGDMRIDQRNAGASVTPTNGQYTVDRWQALLSVASKFSVQQNAGSVTPPAGYKNYLGVTSLSAYSVGASEIFSLRQTIEGYNISDLAWGTANAKTVTLSFWVRSSLTGTFGGAINSNGNSYSYPFSYVINNTNTWEQKSITVVGPISGTWGSTNGNGISVIFSFGAGSTFSGTAGAWVASDLYSATGATSVVGTNGATFYITGVQLEVGSVATPFERRPYGTELALCQRYFLMLGGNAANDNIGAGQAYSTTSAGIYARFPVTMRTAPTLDTFTASNWSVFNASGGLVAATAISFAGGQTTNLGCTLSTTVSSGLVAGSATGLLQNSTSARLPFNAEL